MYIMDIHHLIQSRNHENESDDELDNVLEAITNKIELAEVYFKLGHVYCRTYGDLEQSDYYYTCLRS